MKTTIKVLSLLIAAMGVIHMAATFSPLIDGKLTSLDHGTRNAMIYMSLMCGLLLVVTGGYLAWVMGKLKELPALRPTVLVVAKVMIIDGVAAVYFMPHNPFAWATSALCIATCLLAVRCYSTLRPASK